MSNDTKRNAPGYSLEAHLATEIVIRWGMVAATPDGEDSSGRAKVRLLTPQELIERACETAQLLSLTFAANGWSEPLVSIRKVEEGEKK